jgi:hypothetical protein
VTQQNTEMAVWAKAGQVAAHTDELMGELAPLFARVEPRRTCRDHVQALMGGLPRAKLLDPGRTDRAYLSGSDAAPAGTG